MKAERQFMTREEALDKVLAAYRAYYDISRESRPARFAAEAVFSHHEEQYVLVRKAKISEVDTKEFVYFAAVEKLDLEDLEKMTADAWEYGLRKVKPGPNHRSSDISVVILTDALSPEAAARAGKLKYSRSYMWSLRGWSNLRLAVYDLKTGTAAHNRLGGDLKKTICHILGRCSE